jgi:hypothetical protein
LPDHKDSLDRLQEAQFEQQRFRQERDQRDLQFQLQRQEQERLRQQQEQRELQIQRQEQELRRQQQEQRELQSQIQRHAERNVPNYEFRTEKRKTTISELDGTLDSMRDNMYRGGLTPFQRITQGELSRTLETGVTGQLPTYIQQEIDDENLARKEREINLKIKKAQLDQLERYNNENKLSNSVAGDSRMPLNLADINDFQLHLEKAYAGDKESQFKIGSMYEFGKGTGKNQAKAIEWYKKAALQGHAMAQTIVGYVRPVEVSKPPVAPKSSVSTDSPKPVFTPTPTPHSEITPAVKGHETASIGMNEAVTGAISFAILCGVFIALIIFRLRGLKPPNQDYAAAISIPENISFSKKTINSKGNKKPDNIGFHLRAMTIAILLLISISAIYFFIYLIFQVPSTATPSQASTPQQVDSTARKDSESKSESFVLKTETDLEIREEPTAKSKNIAKIPAKSYIISIKKDYTDQNGSEWSLITLGPYEGWVPKHFLSKITKYQK